MNKYAIERLESEKYRLMIENKEIELNKLSNKGMPMMVYEGNLRYIELLQSAIKQLSSTDKVLAEGKIKNIEMVLSDSLLKIFFINGGYNLSQFKINNDEDYQLILREVK